MAFILKVKKKGVTYHYVAQNVWVNGVSKHKIIMRLGTTDDIIKKYQDESPQIGADSAEVGENGIERNCPKFQFSAVAALYDLATRLNLIQIIDNHAPKRDQGLSVGEYMLLAAINRAVEPVSKLGFFDWFQKTVLVGLFPEANKSTLSSASFWNHMTALDTQSITAIEDEISKQVITNYDISTECLLFDNTNFFTFINTTNPAKIPQRGNSKEKRKDLKIIGLSLMVSPDNNIPLFHETYPGNRCDSKQFIEIIDRLKERCKKICNDKPNITLVFDKGNNSSDIVKMIIDPTIIDFHFVGSLRFNQCPEVLNLTPTDYSPLEGDQFGGTTVYRYQKNIYQNDLTVVVTDNPNLREAQIRGLDDDIRSCQKSFDELSQRLAKRECGEITKGKKPTFESVFKNIKDILSADYMKKIFVFGIDATTEGSIKIWYKIDDKSLECIKSQCLGKTILFTNRSEWTNEKIVSAYRAQFHVEESFKQLKNTKYLSFRPVRHFTDHNIIVHSFYCILAYTLTCLLQLEMKKLGYNITINKALAALMEGMQVVKVKYVKNQKAPVVKMMLTDVPAPADAYISQYNLERYIMRF